MESASESNRLCWFRNTRITLVLRIRVVNCWVRVEFDKRAADFYEK